MPLLALLAVSIIALAKVPTDFVFPMHWGAHSQPDWQWPRMATLAAAPILGVTLLATFAAVGRFAPLAQLEAGGHVLRVMLTTWLGLLTVVQFGLLMIGVGSDIDVLRLLSLATAIVLLVLGNELRRAEPQPYAGLRLPWTPRGRTAWVATHQITGACLMLCAIALGLAVWQWPDPGTLILILAATMVVPLLVGAVVSRVLGRR